MPVHRHVHDKRGSVYALTEELDAWIESRKPAKGDSEKKAEAEAPPIPQVDASPAARRRPRLWLTLAAFLCICLAATGWLVFRHRATAKAESRIRSLAVLPLRNLSGDSAQDYLPDGITEDLIGRLSNIHDLRVISHTSVMRFKDTQLSIPEIARTLGVDAVVEGSVIREGDHIRVTAQLIRGPTDAHFWSETYDREVRDALTLESELAQSIAEKVEVTVTGQEHERLSFVRPVAPEVYESYLKGTFALGKGNKGGDEESVHYFEDALNRDATFAPAYLGMAEAYTNLGTIFDGLPPETTRPQVMNFARKALALDPNLVEAHVALAFVLQEEWHWTEAESEYRRALELNPNDADAYSWFALWLICQGRTDEALAAIERARALDPVGVSGASVARIQFMAHRYEDSIRELRSVLALQPDNALDLMALGFALIADDRPAEAIPVRRRLSLFREAVLPQPARVIRAYAHAGRRDDALRLLAIWSGAGKTGVHSPAGAFVNAYLGPWLATTKILFYWLDQAFKEQSNILQFLKVHPYFDPIRSDPRFADLVRRVGLG